MTDEPRLRVVFFKTPTNHEPVREWLKSLTIQDKKIIGEDIKTVQFGWPMGMPLVRKIEPGLWEVRSNINPGIARVFFTGEGNRIVLLHSFVKKSTKTPQDELTLARKRLAQLGGGR